MHDLEVLSSPCEKHDTLTKNQYGECRPDHSCNMMLPSADRDTNLLTQTDWPYVIEELYVFEHYQWDHYGTIQGAKSVKRLLYQPFTNANAVAAAAVIAIDAIPWTYEAIKAVLATSATPDVARTALIAS